MTVQFGSLSDIKEFVNLATMLPFSVRICDGDRAVNAKSFMEMFTLNFTHPLKVDVGEHEASFSRAAEKFIIGS